MNKLLVFPLAFLLLVTLFLTLYSGKLDDSGGTIHANSTGSYINTPGGGQHNFNIWNSPTAALGIIIAAILLGGVTSIHFLGSGLGEFGNKLVFDSIMFLGIWGALTLMTFQVVFSTLMFSILWMLLTFIYVVGLGIHISSSGAGG
jgi:hypothetical protein